jgi:membrane-bound lytic murein transglycosylase D
MFKNNFKGLLIIPFFVIQFIAISSGYSQDVVADTTDVAAPQEIVPSVDGESIRQRLSLLQSSVPLVYNEYVHAFVDFFTYRKPSFTKTMLERKNYFFPIFEEQLRKYNIPDEIKYLSLIESGLNPKAISYAGAAGLWQFMPKTGRIDFGLRVDKFIDERHHVLKSTEAACKYMKQLYNIFGDWELVLAAYNTGPGNVKRAIRKAGGGGFWQIYPYLHKQTRSYVPQYVAMIYMMHYASDYGIFPEKDEVIPNSSPIMVSNYLNLTTLARLSNIPYEDLQMVNPHIITKELPDDTRNLVLSIPELNYAYFDANKQMIMDSASKRILPIVNRIPTIDDTKDTLILWARNLKKSKAKKSEVFEVSDEKLLAKDNGPDEFEEVAKRKPTIKYHTIKRGENLSQIATHYGIDMYDIKAWNNIKKTNDIKSGRKLKLYLENAPIKAEYFAKNSGKSDENSERKSKKEFFVETKTIKAKYHTVKKGQTLTEIASIYDISIGDISEWNNLKKSNIRSGQKLKLFVNKNVKIASSKSTENNDDSENGLKPKFHVVLKGDTIWSIAQRYEGSSVDKIRKLNDIRNNNLKPGQKLRVT